MKKAKYDKNLTTKFDLLQPTTPALHMNSFCEINVVSNTLTRS